MPGVIYLLHGRDSFGVRRGLQSIRDRLGADNDALAGNSVTLDGASLTALELMQHVTAMPFLAPARLVVVDGLLSVIGSARSGRARQKRDDPLDPWRPVAERLAGGEALPETTTLIFLEGDIDRKNPAFALFAPLCQVNEYQPPRDKELPAWVAQELDGCSMKMTPAAIRALCEAVGPDLWALHGELRKLETYALGGQVDEKVVADMVAQARETRLWDLTDAVVAGQEKAAISSLARLLADGEPAALLANAVARQYRQLALVKDLRAGGATDGEVARQSGLPEWKVERVAALAARYSWADLRRGYALLVDADLSVKRGLQDDESALQLALHELCGLAPRSPAVTRGAARGASKARSTGD
jgi:DNA polymerase-3 subunit delta